MEGEMLCTGTAGDSVSSRTADKIRKSDKDILLAFL